MNRLPTILMVALIALGGLYAQGSTNDESGPDSKLEIKKFRFRRHNRKNFERLVIEFVQKGGGGVPDVKTNASMSGKEATILFERALLVGSIPEALINDSYVAKSRFLGPISINTDGPTPGFTIRTFLKEPVGVDAFWLNHPARLVLDVFPSDSPRVEGRVPEGQEERGVASYRGRSTQSQENPNSIVCYPVSAAVSATVTFHPQSVPSSAAFGMDPLSFGGGGHGGPEPVICFMASSRVVPSVAYKPKSMEFSSYVPWEGFQRPGAAPQAGPPTSLFPPTPPAPGAPPPNLLNGAGGPKPPGTSSLPTGMNGAKPNIAGPSPASIGGANNTPKSYVVTDVPPGRTQLGAPLISPSQVQRLPVGGAPAKLPGSFGEALAAGTNKPQSANLLPPLK